MLDQVPKNQLLLHGKLSIEDCRSPGKLLPNVAAKRLFIAIFSLDPALYQLLSDSNLTWRTQPL